MKKAFIIYGIILCSIFAYASHNGWDVADSLTSGKWGPHGQGGHMYHK